MTAADAAETVVESWGILRATGGGERLIDEQEALRACRVLLESPLAVELMRLPYGARRVVPCIDPAAVVAAAAEMSAGAAGVYFSVNPVAPSLARDMRVGDALCRRWLDIDIDPDRPKDTNATDAEHEAARKAAVAIHEELSGYGWPAPALIDSGNGWRLLYPIDLPNDLQSRVLVKKCLDHVARLFGGGGVTIDTGTAAANCHCKLPGTWARKGPHSADRPHRPVRLAHAPAEPVAVPVELLQELAGPTPPPKPPPGAWALRVPGRGGKAYGRAALDREAQRVLMAREGDPNGGRNTALNRAAFNCYQLVAGGALDDHEVYQELLSAAIRSGLPEREARGVIGRAREAGLGQPRGVPDRPPEANGAHRQAQGSPAQDGEPVTIRGSQIKPAKVSWLWPGRIPLGKLTTFAGVGGLGKTFVLCDIAARVTRGLPWPDQSQPFGPCDVLFVSGEDEPDDTLVPRMMEMGADLSRVRFLRTEVLDRFTLRDLDTLEKAAGEMDGPGLVVIDPPTAYLGGVDDHRNAELRGLLSPLKSWAARRRVAVVFNTHVNKGGGQKVEAMSRVMGSVAWVNAVRAAHLFAKDPEDHTRRFFIGMKLNLGKERKGLVYRIADTDQLAKIEWLGDADATADQAVNREPSKPRRVVASEWLVERFRERLEWPSDDLFRAAREANISRDAVFEAKARLDLPKAKKTVLPNGDTVWAWWVPPDWERFQEDDERKGKMRF